MVGVGMWVLEGGGGGGFILKKEASVPIGRPAANTRHAHTRGRGVGWGEGRVCAWVGGGGGGRMHYREDCVAFQEAVPAAKLPPGGKSLVLAEAKPHQFRAPGAAHVDLGLLHRQGPHPTAAVYACKRSGLSWCSDLKF